jgi:hypothetical protein
MTTPFWLNNPNNLFKSGEITHVWPSPEMSFEAKLNAITRLVILITLLGYLLTQKTKIILSGILTLGAIVLLYIIKTKDGIKEAFTTRDLYNIIKTEFTEPTQTNPGMNVLLTEIDDNPHRKRAAPAFNPIVEEDINKKTKQFVVQNFDDTTAIDERLFKDLGDNFNFDQSMRSWHSTANTTIPNDQKSFTDFCYGDMISCRDETNNELACTRNMPPRWTNY